MMSMKWIGLTGGIASGKTTVSRLLAQQNLPVIDADQVSHKITQIDQSGYLSLVSYFGTDILDQQKAINRKKLGEIVFNDKNKLQELEKILHPLIKKEVALRRQILEQQGHKICFYDVPLLFEKNLQSQFDLIILVYVPENIQLERLMARNQLTLEQAQSRLQSQWPIRLKAAKADLCIDNSTDLADLEFQIKTLIRTLS